MSASQWDVIGIGESSIDEVIRLPGVLGPNVKLPVPSKQIRYGGQVATTLATIGAIVGEYFGAPRASLGQYIAQHASYFNFERSWAAIILAAGLGVALYVGVLVLERLIMPWHSSFRTPEV